jgi:hypothetical protein
MGTGDSSVQSDDRSPVLRDLPIGLVRRTRGRTLSLAEIRLLQQLTGTMDEVNACSIFLAIMSGLRDSTSIPHGIMLSHHFDIVAALSAGAEFIEPVKDDDTIVLETRLVGARASRSQPTRGIMEITEECLNQHNVVLVRRHRAFLFRRTFPQVE